MNITLKFQKYSREKKESEYQKYVKDIKLSYSKV